MLTLSTAFAGMGFMGSLMGFIQMLIGMTDSPSGYWHVAGPWHSYSSPVSPPCWGWSSGAPLKIAQSGQGRVDAPSTFSRVSWYFPLLH
jgi:hypothetical protein